MHRRHFLNLLAYGGTAATSHWAFGCHFPVGSSAESGSPESRLALDALQPAAPSPYGHWETRYGIAAFVYDADQDSLPFAEWDPISMPRTRRHWVMMGNRAIRLQAANDGTVALFYEAAGLRWLVAPEPAGSGVSIVEDGGKRWSTYYAERPRSAPSVRVFGPTWFRVRDESEGLALERTVLCPEGEAPWVLVRVTLSLAPGADGPRTLRHVERWALRPRFLNVRQTPEQAKRRARLAVSYDVAPSARGLHAREVFADRAADGDLGDAARSLFGEPARIVLERLGETQGEATHRADDGSPHPTLEIATSVTLRPGETRELWFRFGLHDDTEVPRPERLFARSLAELGLRLPRAFSTRAPEAVQEIPWHAAMLTGGLSVDRVVGGHTLNQGSAYAYVAGFNGAARDPLQHALPLVYIEPALALSVLRNTCAWAKPNGDLPYALNAAKRPTNLLWRPSDSNLWALWLAAEYAARTGDLQAFDRELAYHPQHLAEAVPLREHLRRQFRFVIDFVARGEKGHVRILNADWNDLVLHEPGIDPEQMNQRGGSVLNSAMASWVLGVFAGLADRLGEPALAKEAREHAEDLRRRVAAAYNGQWFHRAYAPDGKVLGDTDLWLEVQPWAILCGAADRTRARALLELIDQGPAAGSPLGARVRWPVPSDPRRGDGTYGGIWYSINMTLIWAAARVHPELAWSQWRRMTLRAHTLHYPEIWEGTLSGPDAWNAPESSRPGRTWVDAQFLAMQAYPVNNMHSHSQPLLAYLRLLGVEPTERGTLARALPATWEDGGPTTPEGYETGTPT
ncbi:GH36-type glycosyl hydrolase domain-containing protein [Pendulispora albinea]|uniref:Glycosyl hydrolase 94 catalytic domain-containing protein n=1 Tax=Pendulispora albinea TaxID=2741071 RepID=A0ABZ2LR97_9BACT